MKRASEVLILVGMIVSFITTVSIVITSIVFFVLSSDAIKEAIIQGIKDGSLSAPKNLTPEQAAQIFQTTFLTLGIVFLVWAVLILTNGIIANNARKNPTKENYILNIVFGFLSGMEINAIGGIFGLIALDMAERNKNTTVL